MDELDIILAVPAEVCPGDVTIRLAGAEEAPLLCLADLCRALGLDDPAEAAARLDDDEKVTVILNDGAGGRQEMTFVTEHGLPELLFDPDEPRVDRVRRWVYGAVLPALREYGYYPPPACTDPLLLAEFRRLVAMLRRFTAQLQAQTQPERAGARERARPRPPDSSAGQTGGAPICPATGRG
jgi:prophage antirepressor-like protein